jgi:tRNA-splicing endonuclease subunit Sen54
MADADEDSSFLRATDAADVDLTEETQDFRFLDKLTWVFSFAALLGLQD